MSGLLAAVSVFSVVKNFSNGFMFVSLQTNLEEIRTLLKYNDSLQHREILTKRTSLDNNRY